MRWRWAATTALALPRFSGGRRTAPQLQRMKAEDLLATVFPTKVACLENIVGDRQIPDHPLVEQTLRDCLTEAMDVDGWLDLAARHRGRHDRGGRARPAGASPLAAEIPAHDRMPSSMMHRWRNAARKPADASLERPNRPTISVHSMRPRSTPREEAWPDARDADEMHEVLTGLGFVTAAEADAQGRMVAVVAATARAARATRVEIATPTQGAHAFWCAAERRRCCARSMPMRTSPRRSPRRPNMPRWRGRARTPRRADARARLGALGPVTAATLADTLGVDSGDIGLALVVLEREGSAMRGRFTPATPHEEWCERHLLARIHRYTLKAPASRDRTGRAA